MNLDEATVVKDEAFARWVTAKDDFARRMARRDLDVASAAWDVAWEAWAVKVGLPVE